MKLRLLADLIETTFDYSSVASAMKEDVWQTCVYIHCALPLPLPIYLLLILCVIALRCVDEMSELLSLLEQNPTVEFSTLVLDEEENFKAMTYT